MKNKMVYVILTFFGLFIFLLTLELGSWTLLGLGIKPESGIPDFPLGSWKEVEQVARGNNGNKNLAKMLLEFQKNHLETLVDAPVNFRLINEPGHYPPEPVHHKIPLLINGQISPNINDTFILRSISTKEIKYKVHYETDNFGRRKMAIVENPDFNLVLLGCSFTWGEGLPTEKTFSGLLMKSLPGIQIHNLGRSALGVTSIHKILRDDTLTFTNGINKNKPTIVLFTFIEDHYRRALGSSRYLQVASEAYDKEFLYEIGDDGTLIADRTFSQTLQGKFNKLFGASHLARLTGIELPLKSSSHYELIARVLGDMKSIYSRHLNLKNFIVASFPWGDPDFEQLAPFLRKEGIVVFDYSPIDSARLFRGHQILLTDPHPSELSHELYAKLLLRDLAPYLELNQL